MTHRHPAEVHGRGLRPFASPDFSGWVIAQHDDIEVIDRNALFDCGRSSQVGQVCLTRLVASLWNASSFGPDVLVRVVGKITHTDDPRFPSAVGRGNTKTRRGVARLLRRQVIDHECNSHPSPP